MYKVTFKFEDGQNPVETFAQPGETILDVAKSANVAIDAPCGGNAACGKCRIRLVEGNVDTVQTILISDEDYAQGWRLACVSKVIGNVTVLVPDIASAYKSRMRIADLDSPKEVEIFEKTKKDVEEAGIRFENDLDIISVKMSEPTLDDTMPDLERLIRAVKDRTKCTYVIVPFVVIHKLAHILRVCHFDVQCVIRRTKALNRVEVLDILSPREHARIRGLAIDIGTTTVAALIVDLKTGEILAKASAGNGQIRYGADVINRIIASTKEGGSRRLQDAVIKETINPMIDRMCKSAKVSRKRIYRMCIAGNTTMNHLLLGVYADPIRMEPWIPTFYEVNGITAGDLGIDIDPHAKVIIAPNIGSYVGGDITAGTFASCIWNKPTMSMFIDLGTNGEIVIGNNEFMVSCACSAGPAFEGGDISCGMRATDGAIDSIVIDPETMEPSYTVIGDEGQKPIGICGSGIIDLIAELFRCRIIDQKGKFARDGGRVRHDPYGIGSYVIAYAKDAGSVKDVEINEVDIDNFIRAKGAIFSAIRVMLHSLDFTVDMIDDIYVAGGIGSSINMDNAVYIGMFPDISREKFHYIGNSSLSGAYLILLSREAEQKVHEVARNMTYMELSSNPTYMDEFVACCFLPHTDARLFPSLTYKK